MEEEEEEEPRLLSAEEAAASLTCLASFAKNYLPILFNTISSSSQEERPLLLETVGEYAKITESSRLNGLFQNVMKKLLTAAAAGGDPMTDEPELEANKVLLLELSLALMPALDEASSEFLFKSSTPFLSDPSGSVQKRAYKLLQLMGEEHTSLMQRKIGDLQTAMIDSLPLLWPGANKWRLRCILKLVEHLGFDVSYMKLIGAVMGEVILGTKCHARKSRECAFQILVSIAQKVDYGSAGQQLGDLFSMLLAGLAGTTPHMVSATILALSRLVFEYAERVGQLAPPLLDSVMLLLQHKSREIVTAALGFAKVAAVALDPDLLRQYMKSIVSNLLVWSSDSRNRFRLKVKVILERLVRRTSYEEVLQATPEEHKKLIIAVNKRLKRAKKSKAKREEEEEETQEPSRMRLKGGYEAALYGDEDEEEEDEEEEDEGMEDLPKGRAPAGMRRSVDGRSRQQDGSSSSAPTTAAARTKFGFPANNVGKPIIVDEEEEKVAGKKRRRMEEEAEEFLAPMKEEEKERKEVAAVLKNSSHANAMALAEQAEEALNARPARSWDQTGSKRRKRIQPESKVLGGQEYRPKKGKTGGDVKKAGRPDPFAYVPFDKRQLNQKKRHRPVKKLSQVFNATKEARGKK
uniref:Ribosomal RNA-processing protein 12-like conserved domain-containing protein n=1 Tax=Guillardia theta TaxID=55529 RepID=A0A7S4P203_GUITH|mmetsp:Transcript_41567/g.131026  ORF Transcript_41567/g.131026 Transcript_41567/m.131026 type:complete len:634 (+) Transcript_41567:1-1902(+)